MTGEQYLEEHSRHEGEERNAERCCEYCGDEIYPGESAYNCDGGYVHPECILEYIEDSFTAQYIAEKMGFDLEVL